MLDDTVRFFLERIVAVRAGIHELVLFGSRARGDAKPDSDYDILVIVPAKSRGLRDALYDAVMDTLLAKGRLVSLKIFPESEFDRLRRLSTPFFERIQAEGVTIG